ncbi:MAG: tripartite tricarboxylate transporter substrate binding protein [Gracilibacteraceae bacterium]|nr:tripartite tricarboxylate transporter substrate binding protein [Gracilibacteraceae bacterium]
MRLKRVISLLLCLVMVISVSAGCSAKPAPTEPVAQEPAKISYPERNLQGIITWGAGGSTDNFARAITPSVEKTLGKSIVLQNQPGANGSIATKAVYDKPADGYTILYGAENACSYKVMEQSDIDYEDFIPINLVGRGISVVIVPPDSPYKTMTDLVEAAKAKPGKIKMASTGPGGLTYIVTSMVNDVNGIEFNSVPFDGEGPAAVAMIGGHADVSILSLTSFGELYKAGKVRPLCAISDEPIPGMPEIPLVIDEYPEYKKVLPWGPFYCVFVKKDTPKEIVDILTDAYMKAYKEDSFQQFLANLGTVPMGLTGDEAAKYIKDFKKVTSWLLYKAGAAKVNPEDIGIEKME